MGDMNYGRNSLRKSDCINGYNDTALASERAETSPRQRSYSSAARQEQLEQRSRHSQFSPADMQTTEHHKSTQQRLYLTPEQTTGSSSLTGSAGTATYIATTEKVINDDTTGNGREYIRSSLESSVKDSLIKNRGYTPQSSVAITSSERAIARVKAVKETGGAAAGLDQLAATAFKPVSIAGSYADKKLKVGEKTGRNLRYASKRFREAKAGLLSGKEASLALLKRGGNSLGLAGITTVRTFGRTVEEFHDSDDLGVEAIRNTKDAMVATSRTLKVTSRAVKSIIQTPPKVKRSLRTMQKTAQKAQQAARYAAIGIKANFKALSNPVVLKSLAMVGAAAAVIILLMACVSSISALFSSFTYPASDGALTDAYAYVTELDTNLEKELKDIPTKPEWSDIDVFNINAFTPKTDPIPIISYLSVKYEEFSINEVKGEIDTLHAEMYHLVYTPWTEVKHHSGGTNPDGTSSPGSDETIEHLDVTLNYTPFQAYVALHKAEMFPKTDDYTMYETYNRIGGTSLRTELGFPFVGKTVYMSSRYGWRLDPVNGTKSFHGGIDIPMAAGTPINATMGGKVTTGYDGDGYGNYVVITSENRKTLYGHCSSFLVADGQTVTKGQEIANVGNTGKSTDNHLHLEFEKNGKNLNPFFFIESEQFVSGINGGLAGVALGDEQFTALIAEAEKYLGYPYVFGGKTPQTSFDCSGFVSWVVTHSGVKQISASAQGLYDNCTPITATEVKPGDLIFFQGTYNCPDTVSHVAFYVGNGLMLHCGDPIQYSSFKTIYWQDHFYAFGRLN